MKIKRTGILLKPDSKRLMFRPFDPSSEQHSLKIIARVMSLTEEEASAILDQVLAEFNSRHHNLERFLLRRFEQVRPYLLTDLSVSETRKLLIGAYFTQEYSLESAALFNPSIVWHPDQSGVPEGGRRFILSLRATGEGHVSSITFRTGIVDRNNKITVDDPTPFAAAAEVLPDAQYEKELFRRKLYELGLVNDFTDHVLSLLEEGFSLPKLVGD